MKAPVTFSNPHNCSYMFMYFTEIKKTKKTLDMAPGGGQIFQYRKLTGAELGIPFVYVGSFCLKNSSLKSHKNCKNSYGM